VKFEAWGNKAAKLDELKVGQALSIKFDLTGRSYKRRDGTGVNYFNGLKAWDIEPLRTNMPAEPPAASEPDELPF
jgi:hypothetical protein